MPGVLITERLDTKTGDRILTKIDETAVVAEETRQGIAQASEQARQDIAQAAEQARQALNTLVDTVEPTQENIKAAQVVIQEAQVTMQAAQAVLKSGHVATHDEIDLVQAKMNETLLPLTGEEIPEQLNPITLMDLPQYIYWNESEHPFQFGGGSLKRESGSWLNGEEVIVVIQTKSKEGWGVIWDEKFSEPADFERKKLPQLYNDGSGLRIHIKQKVEGDGYHIWSYSFISAERTE